MPKKTIFLQDIGDVVFMKRKNSRSIRIKVSFDGIINVSLPIWAPYKEAIYFVKSKNEWILSQLKDNFHYQIKADERIGKAHRVRIVYESRDNIVSRVTNSEIIIKLPLLKSESSESVQQELRKAAIRALKKEAKVLLPQRLDELAKKYKFKYRSVSIKNLKSRWGSCSSQKDIALNCFLMQLPWDLIDYVLLHELLHTRIMAHGNAFWSELNNFVPNLQAKRNSIKSHHPKLTGLA